MRFYHSIFQCLHFDFGTMLWSVNHMPLFGAILSITDHRKWGMMHNLTFYAFMKVLTNGKIRQKQAQSLFDHIDLALKGDIHYSELSFLAAVVIAHKDHMEREFLYMNAWKLWVTFNEHGMDRITTREFRRAGLFFDFDYPTMYEMFRDYNWDDERQIEFERFRFFLMSCIHFRQIKRAEAKYIRYRQFKVAVLKLLRGVLTRVLLENVYPSPMAILRAIKTIKIPPMMGTERVRRWSDCFNFTYLRNYVHYRWDLLKLYWVTKLETHPKIKCCCKWLCCGLWCFSPVEPEPVCCRHHRCTKFCKFICCCFCGRKSSRPLARVPKPVIVKGVVKDDAPDKEIKTISQAQHERHSRKYKRMKLELNKHLHHKPTPAVSEWDPLGKPKCGIL